MLISERSWHSLTAAPHRSWCYPSSWQQRRLTRPHQSRSLPACRHHRGACGLRCIAHTRTRFIQV